MTRKIRALVGCYKIATDEASKARIKAEAIKEIRNVTDSSDYKPEWHFQDMVDGLRG